MRQLILVGAMSLSSALYANTVATPSSQFPELEKIAKQTSLKEVAIPKLEQILNKSNQASAYFTYGQTSFNQSGSGQKYDTENSSGTGVYATYEHSLLSGNELSFKTWVNRASFKEPANIGGDEVAVQRFLVSGAYSWTWKQERSMWQLDAGASFLSQNPESFSTGEKLLPQYMSVGPSLGGGYRFQVSQTWTVKSGVTATLPLLFKEYGANSGYHDLSWHYLANLLLEIKLNRSLSFSFGIIAEGDEHKFTGDGERGVEDADVSYVSFAVPMGVTYAF